MELVTPRIHLLAQTERVFELPLGLEEECSVFDDYLQDVGAPDWSTDAPSDAEELAEIAGRFCYRSFGVGLNPNVTKIREGNQKYIENIALSRHGSVFEHSSVTFLFQHVSRVFTHELVRHRVGVGISQESMRYVRLTNIPFWFPEWCQNDPELFNRCQAVVRMLEEHQTWMTSHFKMDDPATSFHQKKLMTSFMRRFAPEGVATSIVWTANLRTLRHVLELRTQEVAEEEIRLVFQGVGKVAKAMFPNVFGDFEENDKGELVPKYSKI